MPTHRSLFLAAAADASKPTGPIPAAKLCNHFKIRKPKEDYAMPQRQRKQILDEMDA
jgi:hypothetical protein